MRLAFQTSDAEEVLHFLASLHNPQIDDPVEAMSVPHRIHPSVRSYTQFIWGGIVGQLREFLERLVFPKGSMHVPLLLPYTDEIHCS